MGPDASGCLEPAELAQECLEISRQAWLITWPGEFGGELGIFPTRRRALAFLASWREPDRVMPGSAPPYQRPGTTCWVLGSEPYTVLSDEGCIALLYQGSDLSRPPDAFGSPIFRQWHLDAPCPQVTSRLIHCAHIYATVRAALVTMLGGRSLFTARALAVMGGMRASLARLIVGVDVRGILSDPEPYDPARFPIELEPFRVRALPDAGAAGAADEAGPAGAPAEPPAPQPAPGPETGSGTSARAIRHARRGAARP